MIFTKQRFNFGDNIDSIKTADFTNEQVILNGTEEFQRIPLQEIDLKKLSLPYNKVKKEKSLSTTKLKPLNSGKYKIQYNNKNYYMTYLDELDLFKYVVIQP